MKKKTYLFALMAMALTLGSCSDNENGIGGETSKYITVSTSIGNMTRVATDANGGQTFEEGDEISVYAWTGDATAVPAATGNPPRGAAWPSRRRARSENARARAWLALRLPPRAGPPLGPSRWCR